MLKFKEYRLGTLAEITSSKRIFFSDYVADGIPFFRSKEVIDLSLGGAVSEPLYISNERYFEIKEKYGAPVDGDILLSAVGERAGMPYVVKQQGDFYFKDGNLIWFKNILPQLNANYFSYWLKSSLGQQTLESIMIGSAQKALTIVGLKNLTIYLPLPSYQQKVTDILASLDNKIDLLHRQNKTLEGLAGTLFEHWFINGEHQYINSRLGALVGGTIGGEWGKESEDAEFSQKVMCIRGTDIADLNTGLANRIPIRFVKPKKFEAVEPQEGDLIMEISGGSDDQSTGRTMYVNSDVKTLFDYPLVFSNFCRLIRPKRKEYMYFLYSYIQHLYNQGDFFNLENGSSGIRNFNYKAFLNELEYPVPDEKRIIEYHNDVAPYFKKININKQQIKSLTQLRDTLLPKLMSGEVRVETLQEEMASE